MKALITLLGLIFLPATTVSAAALPSDASIVSADLSPTDLSILTSDLPELNDPFTGDLSHCPHRPDQDIGKSPGLCHCYDSGFKSMRAPMYWAAENLCGIFQYVRIKESHRNPQSFTLYTTHGDIDIEIVAKVYFADGELHNQTYCDEQAGTEGYQLTYNACMEPFEMIIDKCNTNCENCTQGGHAADACLIYQLDPNVH